MKIDRIEVINLKYKYLMWFLLMGTVSICSLHAQLNETFEKETVGRYPSLWSEWSGAHNAALPQEIVVIDKLPGQTKASRALAVGHNGLGDGWGIQRIFDEIELDAAQTTEWGLTFNVQALPKSKKDSPGFLIYLQGSSGPLPFAGFRILTQDEGRHWMLFNPNASQNGGGLIITRDLAINDWHELRFVITVKQGDKLSGGVEWILDGKTVNTETLSDIRVGSVYLDSLVIRPIIVQPILGPAKVLVTNLYVRPLKAGKAPPPSR